MRSSRSKMYDVRRHLTDSWIIHGAILPNPTRTAPVTVPLLLVDPVPLAICLAALKAVGHEVER
jgi:hypothetical protein